MNSVWVVVFSNYDPPEVHSLHATEELAQEQADSLEGHWGVEEWAINQGEHPRASRCAFVVQPRGWYCKRNAHNGPCALVARWWNLKGWWLSR